MWRFYNNANGVRFFAFSGVERDAVNNILPEFRFEGVACYVNPING